MGFLTPKNAPHLNSLNGDYLKLGLGLGLGLGKQNWARNNNSPFLLFWNALLRVPLRLPALRARTVLERVSSFPSRLLIFALDNYPLCKLIW